MKILYDPQIYIIQNFGGISRYFKELILNLDELSGVETCVSMKYSNNIYVSGWEKTDHKPLLPGKKFKGKRRLQFYLNRSHFLREIKTVDFDIFHPTYYHNYFLSLLNNKPFVITVHDMTHEKFPAYFPKRDTTSNQKKELIKKADKVIAVSQNTKKDIVEIFGVEESRVDVVYHGSSISRETDIEISEKNTLNMPDRYILFVGRRNQYKNFTRFVKAIAPLLMSDDELHLLCAGGTVFTKSERELLKSLGIENRCHHRFMDDGELSVAYANAICFVFPSLYEGFGLPLIEAFNAGCPVVCSHSGAMPEIAKEGAEYFDPLSESEIRESVKNVIESDSIRKRIVSEGSKRASDFSWKKTAEKTKMVYEKVC